MDGGEQECVQLKALRDVLREAAMVMRLPVRSGRQVSKKRVVRLAEEVLGELLSLQQKFSGVGTLSRACKWVSKGIKCFALERFTESHEYFDKTVQLEVELASGEEAPPSAAEACCVLCRLQMYSCLHVNNYFRDRYCHLHVVGVEFVKLYEKLVNSEHVLVCLLDEFEPLPSKLPRLATHTHLTRVPVLRELASIRDILYRKFQKDLPIKTSKEGCCEMCHIKNLFSVCDECTERRQSIFAMSGCQFSGMLYWSRGDMTIQQFCIRSHQKLLTLSGHSDIVNCLCTVEGACISGGEDTCIIVWNEVDGGQLCVRHHEAGVRCFATSKQGQLAFLISGGADSRICVWNIGDLNNVELLNVLFDVMPINSVAVKLDCTEGEFDIYSACGSNSDCNEVRCWRGSTSTPQDDFALRVFQAHSNYVLCLALSPLTFPGDDGGLYEAGVHWYLYSSSSDRTLKIWDCSEQHQLVACRGVEMVISCMAVYKNILYTGNQSNSYIHLWDSKTLRLIGMFDLHEEEVTSLFVEDGRLFSASLDLTLHEFLL